MSTEKETTLASWQIILILGVLLVALVLGVMQVVTGNGENGPNDNPPSVVLTASSCAAAGGSWDACGSACRGQENEGACIQVCVEYCECTSDQQCPYGSTCVDYLDSIGVCTNTF